MKKLVTTLVCSLMLLSGCGTGSKSANTFKAGTYTGTGAGRNGDITVEVVLTSDKISSVTVTEQSETEGIADPALEKIPQEIVDAQGLGVDVVSGATLTSNGILEAVENALKEAGADVDALKNVSANKEKGEGTEETTDVVVIGGGGAGIAAAASAVENGASVILVEKTSALGGNTLASGLAMNAADPEIENTLDALNGQDTTLKAVLDYKESDFGDYADTLKTLKGQIQEYLAGDTSKEFDSTEWHIIQTYMAGKRTDLDGNEISGKYDLVKVLCENSLDTWHWLGDTVGVALSDTLTSPVGSLWMRGHNFETKQGVFTSSEEYITKNGGTVLLNTDAKELIVEDGAVTGVKCEKEDGSTLTIHAANTIITTGGFGANGAMVKEYNTYWTAIPEDIKTTNVASATGDGITLGLQAGASLTGMGMVQLMPTASAITGQLADGLLVPSQYYMFVNQEGERFVNEYSERDKLASAALSQTDGVFYHIADQNMIPTLQNKATQEQVDAMVEKGIIYKADTLEDLAKQIGCPSEALKTSVEKYNSYVDAGEDPDFGKNVFGTKIETAPFYAVIEKPSVHHTMGGLTINTDAEVLNEDGTAIKGLYAAGEVTGGIHGGNRVGGNAIADIMVFGRIAGKNAATNK